MAGIASPISNSRVVQQLCLAWNSLGWWARCVTSYSKQWIFLNQHTGLRWIKVCVFVTAHFVADVDWGQFGKMTIWKR